jgi:hypothetical protein
MEGGMSHAVTGHRDEPAAAARRWLVKRRRMVAGLAFTALLLGVITLLVLPGGGKDAVDLEPGRPAAVSVDELQQFASENGVVYWAGQTAGTKLELTRTSGGNLFVRYLPEAAPVGDRRPAYTTVGTYPMRGAYELISRATRRPGAQRGAVPGGGLALWYGARATSVYVAFPSVRHLIEVYAPDPREARRLALSGDLARVR